MVKRVLITRAAHQASALAEGLRAIGMEPVMVPTIEIAAPVSFEAVDIAVGRISEFDWVVFTSANAVEYFCGRAGKGLAEVKVAAIGASTAEALRLIGIKVDLMPAKAVAESLAKALVPFARRADGTAARFLLPRAEAARDVLPQALKSAGAEVEDLAVYRNVIPEESVAAIRELFGEGGQGVDAVTFTSGSSVTNLLALLEVSGLRLPMETLRISIGPITSKTLTAHGLKVDGEAAEATVAALVEKVGAMVFHSKYGQ